MAIDGEHVVFGNTFERWGSAGTSVTLEITGPRESRRVLTDREERKAFYGRAGSKCCVPYLGVDTHAEEPWMAIGRLLVQVQEDLSAVVTLLITDSWTGTPVEGAAGAVCGWEPAVDESALLSRIARHSVGITQAVEGSASRRSTSLGKGFVEASLQAMLPLRALRIQAEQELAALLSSGTSKEVRTSLSDLVTLSVALSRVHDESSTARREGLWTWIDNSALYFAGRRQQDPTHVKRAGDRRARRLPEFSTYDAALRQCRELELASAQELSRLDSLLAMVTTVTSARDAQSQESFNQLATVGSIAVAIPALLFTFYGADFILPLDFSLPSLIASFLVAIVLGVGATLLLPADSNRQKLNRALHSGVILIVVMALLAVAGTFAQRAAEPTPEGSPASASATE